MTLLRSEGSGEVSTGFYNNVATQSLRFNGSNHYLTRQSSTAPNFGAGNQKTWTCSFWIKKTGFGSTVMLLSTIVNNANEFNIYINSTGYFSVGTQTTTLLQSSAILADPTNWYNLIVKMDTTQSSDSDKLKLYINGIETSYGTDNRSSISTNGNLGLLSNINHYYGIRSNGTMAFDGYMSELNVIDGTAVSHTSRTNSSTGQTEYVIDEFGEFKKGVWIPKKYTGSYGTQGWRLEFKNTTLNSSGAVGTSSTVGADTSGNGNHWQAENITADDSNMPDSPENNFATWSSLFKGGEQSSSIYADSTLSEGNLQVSVPTNSYMGSTFRPVSGKWYAEIYVKTIGHSNKEIDWGWIQATEYSGNTGHAAQANQWGIFAFQTHIRIYDETSQLGSNISVSLAAGDILQLAWDIDNNKGWVGINNTYYRTDASDGNPSAGTNETFTFTDAEAQNLQVYIANGTSTDVHVANFGQDGSFAGNLTGGNVGTAADANGKGAFKYAPPTGFLACCAANLPDTTLSPDQNEQATDYFNTILYTGNATDTNITKVGFQPDWIWAKNRSNDYHHAWVDSSRGVTKILKSSDSSGPAEGTFSEQITGFLTNGFSVGDNSDSGNYVNLNGHTYVAWNWRLNGGTTSSDTNGTRTTATQTNANTGISIATYNNPSQSNHSFGHGLGSKPEAFIWKARNTAMNWIWWDSFNFTDADRDGKYFNGTIGFTTGGNWVSDVTDTTISVIDGRVSSGNDIDYWCISFKSVEGFSKIGNYTGNGSTDGTFIFLGFRPAWFLLKRIDANANWLIYDSKRDPDNNVAQGLFPNLSSAETEQTGGFVDFVSNGVKLREDGTAMNASGGTFVYLAFAEQPFKFSNAR